MRGVIDCIGDVEFSQVVVLKPLRCSIFSYRGTSHPLAMKNKPLYEIKMLPIMDSAFWRPYNAVDDRRNPA